MANGIIDQTWLPFTVEQLTRHFAPAGGRTQEQVAARHLPYFEKSAANYQEFQANVENRVGMPVNVLKGPCQIERDERFWTVRHLMSLYHAGDR